MKGNIPIVKYELNNMKIQSIMCFLIILLNILISILVTGTMNSDPSARAGSIDLTALIWLFICGIGFFKYSFKFMVANSVTRKKYFVSTITWMIILSASWALGVAILITFCRKIVNAKPFVLYELLYKDLGIAGMVIWLIAALFFIAVFGWCISMLYYRSNKMQKYIITMVPFVLSALITLLNFMSGGILVHSIFKIITTIMGLNAEVPNPFIGALSLFTLSLIICIINMLLIRKTEIKDK